MLFSQDFDSYYHLVSRTTFAGGSTLMDYPLREGTSHLHLILALNAERRTRAECPSNKHELEGFFIWHGRLIFGEELLEAS